MHEHKHREGAPQTLLFGVSLSIYQLARERGVREGRKDSGRGRREEKERGEGGRRRGKRQGREGRGKGRDRVGEGVRDVKVGERREGEGKRGGGRWWRRK